MKFINKNFFWFGFGISCRKFIIIVSWIGLLAFAYKVASIKADYVNFDPFEILEIGPGSSNAEIKKAYRKLSLVYHPDKETGDEKKFMRITKAYAALTDEAAKKNWEEYGNPDGPGAMSFGIALPSWIVEKENSMFVLMVYVLLLMIVLPICVRIWWSNSLKYGAFKVLVDTTGLYYYFLNRSHSMNLRRVVMIIASSFEFNKSYNSEIIERPSDNEEMPLLMKQIPNLGLNKKERPLCYTYSLKARTLLYAHLLRIRVPPNTLEVDKKYIVQKCPYLIQEFVQCISYFTSLAAQKYVKNCPTLETLENAIKLNALIVQAMYSTKNPLLQLPHITEDMLRHFNNRKHNIRNVLNLATMDHNDRRQTLRKLTDEQYQNLIHVLGQMPFLDIDVRSQVLDDEDKSITAGALVTVTVTLTRRNMACVLTSDEFQETESEMNAISSTGDTVNDNVNDSDNPQNVQNNVTKNTNKPTNKPWEKQKFNRNKKGKNAKAKKKPVATQLKNRKSAKVTPQGKQETTSIDDDTSDNKQAQSGQSGSESESESDSGAEYSKKSVAKTTDDEYSDNDDNEDQDWGSLKPKEQKKEMFSLSKQSHSVHCPYFPEDKQEHWWIYIADRKTSTLKAQPYFMTNLVEREKAELKFQAPLEPGVYQYTVYVRSDSYVDMDYTKTIKVCQTTKKDANKIIFIYFISI